MGLDRGGDHDSGESSAGFTISRILMEGRYYIIFQNAKNLCY